MVSIWTIESKSGASKVRHQVFKNGDTVEGSDDEDDAMFGLSDSDEADDLDEAMENALAEENVDLTGLTVMELKEKLRNLGLPVSGNKMELVERLGGSMNVDTYGN